MQIRHTGPLTLLTLALVAAPAAAEDSAEPYLKNIRRLADGDTRSGEAYFDKAGKRILFQAIRGKQPYYQIYVMNVDGSGRRMVSTGKGKTTCAFFHPGDPNLFIYASSHLDKRTHEAPKKKPSKRRYKWDYDDSFDIFLGDLRTGKIVKQLTTAKGYDAECSFSPDGKTICFTARRAGKPDSIYLMNADGSNQRPLVEKPGIDCGGPFFSPDGKWIVYRVSKKGARTMQCVMTTVDGKKTVALTNSPRVNWAPFFHPNQKIAAFGAPLNPRSYKNFDIVVVKTDGSCREAVLTSDPGFDGIPAFSPDGKKIVWSSARAGMPQIYIADFVMPPESAFKAPKKGPFPTSKGPLHGPTSRPKDPHGSKDPHGHGPTSKPTSKPTKPHGGKRSDGMVRPQKGKFAQAPGIDRISGPKMLEDLTWLADDARTGRRAGTPGAKAAAKFVATRLSELGLEPGGKKGSWYQDFSFSRGGRRAKTGNDLSIDGQAWALGTEWRPLLYSGSAAITGPLSFVGYAVRARDKGYDDLAGVELKGKVAIVLTGAPRSQKGGAFGTKTPTVYQDLRYKIAACRDAGASAVLLVRSKGKGWLRLTSGDPGIPVAQLSRAAVEKRLGLNLKALVAGIDMHGAPASEHMRQQVKLATKLERIKASSRNVVGKITGSALPNEVVVVGAHYDHLGQGGEGSLAPGQTSIHNGADDNASGTAALLAIAEALQAARPRRTVLVVAFGAEEEGLIGSKRFVEDSPVPLESIVAMLNMDMIGRLGDGTLLVGGYGSSPAWKAIVQRAASYTGKPIKTQRDGFGPSDHASFYAAGVPVFFLWTGTHVDYHKPSDDPEKIDVGGLGYVAQVAYLLLRGVDDLKQRPVYTKVLRKHAPKRVVTGERGAYFGSIPNYAQDGVKGVLLDGARGGTPAAKAGIKKGDVVVEFAGRTIKNIYDYTNALRLVSPGQTVKVVVMRAGKRVELTAKLTGR